MNHLKTKKLFVSIVVIVTIVVFSGLMVGYSHPSGEELIISNFLCSGVVYDRMILNGWSKVDNTIFEINTVSEFENLVRSLFSSKYYTTSKHTALNSTTITAQGYLKPKVMATVTLMKPNSPKAKLSEEKYLVLSLESKDPNISYSFLNGIMNSFLGRDCQKSIVVCGIVNHELSTHERDIFVKDMFKKMGVQNMETLATGSLVSVTGYTPSVRNMLTVDGKSVNINMALRYSKIDDKTKVYVGSPIITSEY